MLKLNCCNQQCRAQLDRYQDCYTIMLNEQCTRTSGTFCSLRCAIFTNNTLIAWNRPIEETRQREAWTRGYYEKLNRKNKINAHGNNNNDDQAGVYYDD